jgi:hypothetical protein
MTAQRQDGTPSRRRAGDVFRAAGGAARRDVRPAESEEQVDGAPHAGSVPSASTVRKYTLLVPAGEAVALDELMIRARRRTGQRVDKSEILRALLALAVDDAALFAQVVDTVPTLPPIRRGPTR